MNIASSIKKYISAEKISGFMHQNKFWLPFFLLSAAGISAYTQYDFFWDLINYHYYNAWAFWENTESYNIITPPGFMNTFLNPLLDIPLYLLIKHFNNNAALIYAAQGLWFGLLVFLFWKICLLFFDKKNYYAIGCTIFATTVAVTGQNLWFQAGSSTNEVQISAFMLTGLYFTLKYIKYPNLQKASKFLALGLLLGAALAVKPTCIPYIIAGGLSLIIFYRQLHRPFLFISLYTLGGLLGYLLFNGWFMVQHWLQYGNPFLPALNELFSTDWFGTRSLIDLNYIPHTWDILYYPYVMERRSAEIIYYDKRGWIFYTAFLLFIPYALIKRKKLPFFHNPLNLYICSYLFISYILWQQLFGIARYTIIIEMLSALMFTKICAAIRLKNSITQSIGISALFIITYIFVTVPQQSLTWPSHKNREDNHFLYMEQIKLPDDALIAFYNRPIAILIPLLAQSNSEFTTINYRHLYDVDYQPALRNKLLIDREIIKQKHPKEKTVIIYRQEQAVTTDAHKEIFNNQDVLKGFSDLEETMDCRDLQTNLNVEYRICFSKDKN